MASPWLQSISSGRSSSILVWCHLSHATNSFSSTDISVGWTYPMLLPSSPRGITTFTQSGNISLRRSSDVSGGMLLTYNDRSLTSPGNDKDAGTCRLNRCVSASHRHTERAVLLVVSNSISVTRGKDYTEGVWNQSWELLINICISSYFPFICLNTIQLVARGWL